MIIFISPSKSFTDTCKKGLSNPIFLKEKKILLNQLLQIPSGKLKNLFKVSDKTLNSIISYLNSEEEYLSINLFNGTTFKQLDVLNVDYSNNLLILDAFYGIIKPNDNITKYRLDFNVNIGLNLYDYWKPFIKKYINTYLKNDFIIDLASIEYSKMLPDDLNIIRIDFVSSNEKINSFLLKKLRGLMTKKIINNNLKNLEDIKEIILEGFKFNEMLSTKKRFIFEN